MKTSRIQISIEDLEAIINDAKMAVRHDSSLSNIISLIPVKETDSHNGTDKIEVWVKSGYQECIGKRIL